MITTYHPELGESKPMAFDGEIRVGYGGKYRIVTPKKLSGKGVTYDRTYTANDLVPQAQHKVGWNVYVVTPAALKKLSQTMKLTRELLLD